MKIQQKRPKTQERRAFENLSAHFECAENLSSIPKRTECCKWTEICSKDSHWFQFTASILKKLICAFAGKSTSIFTWDEHSQNSRRLLGSVPSSFSSPRSVEFSVRHYHQKKLKIFRFLSACHI
jgi:hypothetical protein